MRNDITLRPEGEDDYAAIRALILRSFSEGTEYSDGSDVVALVEEIRRSQYCIPALSFVAEMGDALVGHFMLSHFPLSGTASGGHDTSGASDIVLLAPVSVEADHFRQGVGTTMLTLGLDYVKRRYSYKGILVEGNYKFYGRFGFQTSAEYGIYPTSGFPLSEPRCMMCMETRPGSLHDVGGYVVYDMYRNA